MICVQEQFLATQLLINLVYQLVRTGELFKGNSSVRHSEFTRHFPFSRATLKSSARCFQPCHIHSSVWMHHRISHKCNIHFTAPSLQTYSMLIIHNFQPSLVIKYHHWCVPDILSGVSKCRMPCGRVCRLQQSHSPHLQKSFALPSDLD